MKEWFRHDLEYFFYDRKVQHANFNKALPTTVKSQAKLAIKDEYTFDNME